MKHKISKVALKYKKLRACTIHVSIVYTMNSSSYIQVIEVYMKHMMSIKQGVWKLILLDFLLPSKKFFYFYLKKLSALIKN